MSSIRKITFKPRWQTNLSVVLVSEWWVNTPITEPGDIARHSARWRGINWNFKKKNFFFFFFFFWCTVYKPAPPTLKFFRRQKSAVYTPLYTVAKHTKCRDREVDTQSLYMYSTTVIQTLNVAIPFKYCWSKHLHVNSKLFPGKRWFMGKARKRLLMTQSETYRLVKNSFRHRSLSVFGQAHWKGGKREVKNNKRKLNEQWFSILSSELCSLDWIWATASCCGIIAEQCIVFTSNLNVSCQTGKLCNCSF